MPNENRVTETTTVLPRDTYSQVLREKQAHAAAIEKTTLVDLVDVYGNAETWVVKTIRTEGEDTVFLTHTNADGGKRLVLPAQVTATIARQRESVVGVSNKRRAHSAAATRRAKLQVAGGAK